MGVLLSRSLTPKPPLAHQLLTGRQITKVRKNYKLLLNVQSGFQYNPLFRSSQNVYPCKISKLRDPPGPVTALASFPGSGNTWIRYLVQQSTGYLTGSIYGDSALAMAGFHGERIKNGSVILVKTHEWGDTVRRKFHKAILLVREPRKALLAEFNRRFGGHLGYAPQRMFFGNQKKEWQLFLEKQIKVWKELTLDWLKFNGPLHIVKYEELVEHLKDNLLKLIEFLNVSVSNATLSCVLENKEGFFKRKERIQKLEIFDTSIKRMIDKHVDTVEKAIWLYQHGLQKELDNLDTEVAKKTY
ncbi:WSCD family member GA21586-like [Limulus polyphemus]|uniref:WSCD family member GA21586-like n=1 Tax=Limulus polyphemus TaxID=6850 RepID=A0ABM1SQX9_LIMPO|nr:WSCD family member GA21586-like [Limulus polyphemus]